MKRFFEETIEFAAGPLTFDAWARAIDEVVISITGFDREAFSDWGYADAFADGVEPRDAAIRMLAKDAIGLECLALAGIDPEDL